MDAVFRLFGVLNASKVAALFATTHYHVRMLLYKATILIEWPTARHSFFDNTIELTYETQGALVLLHLVVVVIQSANLEASCTTLLIRDDNATCVLPSARCSHEHLFMLVV